MTALVYEVNEADFADAVVERSRQVPVVVDFWAAWCGPCKTLGPILERVTKEAGGTVELAKVDVDRNPRLSQSFAVQGIPTVIAFRDGKPVSRFTGAIPEAAVRQFMAQLAPSAAAREAEEALTSPDPEGRLRAILAKAPESTEAAAALALVLIRKGDRTEALELLDRLPPTPEVRRLSSAARLLPTDELSTLEARVAADASDLAARLELGKALASFARYEPALESLLSVVAEDGALREEARQAMVDVFEVLGADHPLTLQYRRRLASVLF
jgi:putative thioredoxin